MGASTIILPYKQPPSKLQIDKAGDKVLLSDNYSEERRAVAKANHVRKP